ncbi:MAG: DUF4398 domain-containing protein [Treponema sp.]|jgi:hypothetical protein|nr:DUF4398 domain-containing protein [Treponema sp.]
MKLKLFFVLCIVLAVVTACAKPPLAEMDAAREAVFRAENDADAVLYGSSSLTRAREALRRMQTEADSKRYDAAKTHAAEAIAAAERAILDGRSGASRAKTEADNLISGLRDEIDETSRNVSGARYSQLDLDYEALDRDIVNAHELTDKAEIDQLSGRHLDALDKARDVRAGLSDINQRVSNAVTRKK